ncbi:hypothetical protein BJF85_13645 [Saccharomonospora sp. CUA-673]|uniref:SAV_915 family protein n=1 Tax=Saccharomonospora sp. CUA-673 TaxID=1904969 RepID=UPI00095D7EA9|nr:SAV_915 family protein [Saccharomonospora sp. CUA-673]OLT48251.1 hypothetical protein BJF85_13645 [Saccharomonospora sp. CUA-673]
MDLELRRYQAQLIAPVFTSPEMLHAGCGPHQPYVSVRTEDLADVVRESGAAGVLVNPHLEEAARYQAPIRAAGARW